MQNSQNSCSAIKALLEQESSDERNENILNLFTESAQDMDATLDLVMAILAKLKS